MKVGKGRTMDIVSRPDERAGGRREGGHAGFQEVASHKIKMLAAQCHPPCFQPILIDELRRSGFTSRWFCGTSRKMRDWLLWLPNLSFQKSKENLTSACVENSGGFDNLTVDASLTSKSLQNYKHRKNCKCCPPSKSLSNHGTILFSVIQVLIESIN